jgi:hypothetical protein
LPKDPVHTNIQMLKKQLERAKQKGTDEPKKPEAGPEKAEEKPVPEKKPEPQGEKVNRRFSRTERGRA